LLEVPIRVFGPATRPATLTCWDVLLWNRVLVQSFNPEKYHRYCFDDPALPLALASAVRFSFFGLPPATIKLPAASSLRASPSFRVSPSNTYPTAAAARSSHGLWVPTAHGRIRGPLLAGESRPLSSTFRVWSPSWRFTPSNPGPVLFRTGSAHGIRPSEVSPPGRNHSLSAGKNPLAVSLSVVPGPKPRTVPTRPSFWVHASRKSLAAGRGFNPPTTGASLGNSPL
jgi:hypothetical protein